MNARGSLGFFECRRRFLEGGWRMNV